MPSQRLTSHPPVPIAMGTGDTRTEEGRAFYRGRLALLGQWICLVSGSFLVLFGGLRTLLWERGEWKSTVVPGKEEEGAKFSDYFNATEAVRQVPSRAPAQVGTSALRLKDSGQRRTQSASRRSSTPCAASAPSFGGRRDLTVCRPTLTPR
jgi:hypothetical protein